MTAQLVATHAAAVGRPQADSRGDGHEPTATTGAHEVALRALVDGCSPTATTSSADAIAAGAKSLSADVRVLPFPACLRQNRLCGRTFLPLPLPCLERKDHPLPREEGTFLPLHGQAPSAEPPFSPPPHPDPPSCMPSSCTIPSRRAQVRMASLSLLGALASLEWGAMDLCTSEGTLEVLLTAADVHASGAPCCRNLKSSEGPG